MRIKKTKVYPFDELSNDAKEKVIEEFRYSNADYDWWESVFDDAAQVGLNITEFELDRGAYCQGEFIEFAEDTARKILHDHGACCPTHETATDYIAAYDKLDGNATEYENQQKELDIEFLHDILEDYRIILQKEYEYLLSDTSIIEMIECNEYEFTADGQLT